MGTKKKLMANVAAMALTTVTAMITQCLIQAPIGKWEGFCAYLLIFLVTKDILRAK